VALQPADAESELLACSVAAAVVWKSFAACIIECFGLVAWLKVAGSDSVSAFGRVVLRGFGAVSGLAASEIDLVLAVFVFGNLQVD
jgi:hypothetical protein